MFYTIYLFKEVYEPNLGLDALQWEEFDEMVRLLEHVLVHLSINSETRKYRSDMKIWSGW
jgi:hypothetical protein